MSSGTWNPLWGSWIIEELVRNQVVTFCISPGSRSTPLTTAAARNPQAQCRIFIDERAAAYFALGHARATGEPAALICTSGTAVANYLPAVVEASVEQLPLLILSADRPPELRDSGANQTIDQTKLFGSYVRWFHDPGCPGPETPLPALLSSLDQAVARTQAPLPGPVHLNFPFREPFFEETPSEEPAVPERWRAAPVPWVRKPRSHSFPEDALISELATHASRRGILSVGRLPQSELPAVKQLAQALGWPLFADITSGMRFGPVAQRVTHYDQLLVEGLPSTHWEPEVIWHLGFPPTSKRWLTRWERRPAPEMVWISSQTERLDASFQFGLQMNSEVSSLTQSLSAHLTHPGPSDWLAQWQQADQQVAEALQHHFLQQTCWSELQLAHALPTWVPEGHALYVGNSLPVRLLDFYGSGRGPAVPIGLNRGASGIDGLIASAAGFAEGLQRPTTLILGDLSTLHDLNSLALLAENRFPITVVLCNNHGGGIFSFLPISQQRDLFEPFFGTPHSWNFSAAAELFHLDHQACTSLESCRAAYLRAVQSSRSSVIEVTTDREINTKEQQRWQQVLRHSFQD